MTTIHAEVNDFVRKDGEIVRVMEVDVLGECYRTSDGGIIGFDEVDEDNVFLESEVYDELDGNIPDAVEVPEEDEHEYKIVFKTEAEIDEIDRASLARLLTVSPTDIDAAALDDLRIGPTDDAVRERWVSKPWTV